MLDFKICIQICIMTFKQSNGFSIKQIDEKAKSLRGVLEPFSEKEIWIC